VSSVTDMFWMFDSAPQFEQCLPWHEDFDESPHCELDESPHCELSFAPDDDQLKTAVGDWVTSSGAAEDNYGPIGKWDTSKVTSLYGMFRKAAAFDADIGGWDVSQVTTMVGTFANAAAFDADIGDWDVSKVTTMTSAFYGSNLQDCPSWAAGRYAGGPC
jgi:surface protein